jgi:hypothetical protein
LNRNGMKSKPTGCILGFVDWSCAFVWGEIKTLALKIVVAIAFTVIVLVALYRCFSCQVAISCFINGAAQLPVAPDTPPLDGPELKLLFQLLRDGVTSLANRFFQRRLSGAASAAPRRYVGREAGVQVNGRVVGPTKTR